MAEEIIEQTYRELADTILEHNPGVDLGRVRAAFELADRAHSGQKRKAGTPYVTHCVAAAQICAEMGLDEDSIVAALLHDCIEDTAITHEDIARQFGAVRADRRDQFGRRDLVANLAVNAGLAFVDFDQQHALAVAGRFEPERAQLAPELASRRSPTGAPL